MRLKKSLLSVSAVVISICIAVALVKIGAVHRGIEEFLEVAIVASVVGGALFASVFTTPIGIVILVEVAQELSPIVVALVGGFGAMLSDAVMFLLVRDGARKGVVSAYRHAGGTLPKSAALRRYRWFANVLGFLIIASPFPDEIGVTLLGLSNAPTSRFLVISFVANAFGILLIGLASRALA